MTVLPDAIRAYEQELMQKADMLVLALKGLHMAAPDRAALVLEDVVGRLTAALDGGEPAARSDADARGRPEPRRIAPLVVARGGSADDVEDFILDVLAENPRGLSVQDIVDSLDAAEIEIKRKTLVVRLHRMVQAGRISALAHGHYALSEAERSRRRA